jgi:hypothetical protein
VGANIWSAVLAVRWPVVNAVIVWLDPEVLLSLLRKIKFRIIPLINLQLGSRMLHAANTYFAIRPYRATLRERQD